MFRDELHHIKAGEESKTKEYEAVCICNKPVTEDMINKINDKGPVELNQETPIRVLHRRPLAVRKRVIHSMKAEKIPGNYYYYRYCRWGLTIMMFLKGAKIYLN